MGRGVPHPVLTREGYPIQSSPGRVTPSSPYQGYPIQSSPGEPIQSCLGGGYPITSWLEGTPTIHTYDGVPPCPDLRWGTPLVQTWVGVPPPPPVEVWADTQSENITFPLPLLRMRAVIILGKVAKWSVLEDFLVSLRCYHQMGAGNIFSLCVSPR